MRWLTGAVLALAAVLALLWLATAPRTLTAADLPDHAADAANGERVFLAAGCGSCHAAPGARGDQRLVLSGGLALESPVGTFVAPNISPDPVAGIGGWSTLDLVNAVVRGVSPDGVHYYPSFPWTSYRHMRLTDAIDLDAYLRTLPPSEAVPPPSEVAFPFDWRRGIGLWKRLAAEHDPPPPTETDGEIARGEYLTVALGHCGECHAPRTRIFGLDMARWLAGAPSLEGDGFVPNISSSREGIGDWSAADIAYLLETGFTPDFDSVGGTMGPVVDNWARLPAEDRAAVAAYLKATPPVPGPQ